MKIPMADRSIWKTGMTLAIIAAFCTSLVAITWQLTAERIASNKKEWLERNLQPALAGLFFDSPVTESMLLIAPPHELPGSEAAIIYRVYAGEEPVAALFVVSARDGYAGPIRLLVGVAMDGTVTGVRVLEQGAHRVDLIDGVELGQGAQREPADVPVLGSQLGRDVRRRTVGLELDQRLDIL